MSVSPIPSAQELREAAKGAMDAGDYRPTDWEVAFHEAGHVVVEVALGSYPDVVYLNDHNLSGVDHAGRTSSRSFLGLDGPIVCEDESIAAIIETQRRRYAATVAAGDLAGGIACGFQLDLYDTVVGLLDEDGSEGTDAEKLRSLVYDMRPGDAELWLESALAEAERLLRERWADVGRVAAALIERRSLSRDDLYDLLL